ncbi:MAG: hypothetical protein ACR2QK_19255 [Acidimicrobiales bacterium]
MTKQESFKRRVRARMEKTGERYVTARRALIDRAESGTGGDRRWVADPEMGEDAVKAATGKGWDDWCDLIEKSPELGDDHAAIAIHLTEVHGLGPWWAQTVTVGYERITGLRLPYQRPDGTFTAGKSGTVVADGESLRELLLSEAGRGDLFPGFLTELRSKPTSKAIRVAIGPGVAEISLEARDDSRIRVAVAHDGLPSFDDVEPWKSYWADWLVAIDESAHG